MATSSSKSQTKEIEEQLQFLNHRVLSLTSKICDLAEIVKSIDYKAWVYMRANNLIDSEGKPVLDSEKRDKMDS